MESNTIALLITNDRLHQALVAVESARKFEPELDVNIAYFDSKLPTEEQQKLFGKNTYWHLKGKPAHFKEIFKERPRFVLDLFDEGYKRVLHIGSDIFFLRKFSHYFSDSRNWACPHLVELPLNATHARNIHKTGIINSDLIMWINNALSREFLNWHYEMLKQVNDDKEGFFFDQMYLDFGISTGHINVRLNSPDNVSYYNLHEPRSIKYTTTFQFSGFVEQIPSMLTRYKVDKKLLTLDVVQLAMKYGELLDEAKTRLRI